MKETIIAYLTDHTEAKAASIAEYIGLKPSRKAATATGPIA